MATTTRTSAVPALSRLAETLAIPSRPASPGKSDTNPRERQGECPGLAIRHLLVPLDGSRLAECALPFALALAQALSARITLLRVLEARGTAGGRHVDPVGWEMLRAEAQRQLSGLDAELKAHGVTSAVELLEGRSAEQIVCFASEQEVDLIVLSSHGEGGLSEWALSSTAQKVVARAQTSILIVPAYAAEGHRLGDLRFGRILVPLDCSSRAECVLPLAETLARAHDADLILGHVVPEPEMPRHMLPSAEDVALAGRITEHNRIEAEQYLKAVQERLGSQGVRVRVQTITSARSARAIRELADLEDVDLLLLSAHGRTGEATERHGSVAARLIQESDRPTIVFQDLARLIPDTTHAEHAAKAHPGH